MTNELTPRAHLIGQQVAVLHIEHRHGDNVSVHVDEDSAYAALAEYCREWWNEDDMGPAPRGDSRNHVNSTIDAYFDVEQDEFYGITTTRIES